MSDLLIRGMEMPKAQFQKSSTLYHVEGTIFVYHDGKARAELSVDYKERKSYPLVPVPPHGRLGDLDEMEKKYSQCLVGDAYGLMPTIIPASQPIDADFWGEEYAEAKGFDNASVEDSMT